MNDYENKTVVKVNSSSLPQISDYEKESNIKEVEYTTFPINIKMVENNYSFYFDCFDINEKPKDSV